MWKTMSDAQGNDELEERGTGNVLSPWSGDDDDDNDLTSYDCIGYMSSFARMVKKWKQFTVGKNYTTLWNAVAFCCNTKFRWCAK